MNSALSTKILQGPGTASGTVLQKRHLRTFALNPGLIYLQKVLKNLFLNLEGVGGGWGWGGGWGRSPLPFFKS